MKDWNTSRLSVLKSADVLLSGEVKSNGNRPKSANPVAKSRIKLSKYSTRKRPTTAPLSSSKLDRTQHNSRPSSPAQTPSHAKTSPDVLRLHKVTPKHQEPATLLDQVLSEEDRILVEKKMKEIDETRNDRMSKAKKVKRNNIRKKDRSLRVLGVEEYVEEGERVSSNSGHFE